ncbi:MAG: 16S rRNA (uracil(1498)-N(3))-methyltransferase [Kiritimatiellales bacterium]
MNLILINPGELSENSSVCLQDGRAEHIRKVLRSAPGNCLRIGLLNGPRGTGTIMQMSGREVRLSCQFEAETPPRPKIDLLLALPRPKVMKRLWAQLAALGVGRIVLTNADKVERCYFDSHVLEPDFYNARLMEGLQQACDTLLPEVRIVKELKPFLEDELDTVFPDIGKKLIADPSGAVDFFQSLETRLLLAVGPEGGWTSYELDLFASQGFGRVGMGPRILRTDTACVALLSRFALQSAS